ncbi:hypothetical protein RND81_06G023500 [Saponaria officinalis]|uniref:Fe2OG dioxygenase domain-containing protein n=1 Tax=Saponaria officinalis TaxID=3572 RepID=A0AAW1K8T9_SAPOF
MEGEKIPIINLQENNSSQKIKEVCEKMGYFRIINHEIPTKLMVASGSFHFYNPNKVASESFCPYYNHNKVVSGSSMMLFFAKNSNVQVGLEWEIIEEYTQAIQKLGIDIVSKMLGDYSSQVCVTHFRMNKYNITRNSAGSDGIGLHSDASLITILQDDEHLGGLEIVNPSGKLVPVDRLPDSLFVILGDIAMLRSNGRYRNVQHKVECKDVGIRLSIATFIKPSINEDIEVHSKFIDVDHPPKYVPFKYEELRRLRASNKFYCGQVLELLRCKN